MNDHTRNIITDTLILMALSTVLGAASWAISKAFAIDDNPALNLMTVMKKAEAKEMEATTYTDEQKAKEKGMKEFLETLEQAQDEAEANGRLFINSGDTFGRTPVMWACYANFNNIDTTMQLEQARAPYLAALLDSHDLEIDQTDNDGWTALHWSAWSGMEKLAAMLIDKGADFNKAEGNGYTPLMLAAMRGNYQVVELLLEKGATLHGNNKFGQSTLQLAQDGAKAYDASFKASKTFVRKIDSSRFISLFTQQLSKTLVPETEQEQTAQPTSHEQDILNTLQKTVGRQKNLNPAQILKAVLNTAVAQQWLTQEQANQLSESTLAEVDKALNGVEPIDVRGQAYKHTVELLQQALNAQ